MNQKNNKRKRGLAFKLIISIFASVALVFMLLFVYNYRVSKLIVEKNLKSNAENMTKNGVSQIEKILASVQKIPDNYSSVIESTGFSQDAMIGILKQIIETNPEIYGVALAFEPYFIDAAQKYYMAYCYRKSRKSELVFPGSELYDYFTMDWYQIPKELNRALWSEPYYDEGAGNTIMSTYSVPLYLHQNGSRNFIGILTADISLEWLQDFVNSIKVYETGYGFLISQNGTIVTHPISELIMNETIFSIAEAQGSQQLREIGRNMVRGEKSFAELEYYNLKSDDLSWLAYAPVGLNGWSIGIVFPVDEFMADINSLFMQVLILGLSGLLIILLIIILISRTITKPLRSLSGVSRKIAEGNFDVELPVINTRDEMKDLHDSFDYMQKKLAEYIANLKETTSAREKIESELRIAREIQMGMIPHIFPPFPNLSQIDLYAMLQPAKEVGGDLYDFFLLDENHLCFAIGDVSGKGVPASLFMAVTRTLLRSVATKAGSPAAFVQSLNQSLSHNNESSMFVTFFLGILNLHTGEISYTNAGHNPPFIIRHTGSIEMLGLTGGIPVGLFEDFTYTEACVKFHKGDKLFLYTDGVTEAEDAAQVLFSEERLEEILLKNAGANPSLLIGEVKDSITTHVGDNVQSDDITMMAIIFYGN
ncbi:MAG: SpoIIE family protein phosphatase [Bacteroidales bacterium]